MDGHPCQGLKETSNDKQPNEYKDKDTFAYTTLSQDQASNAAGSFSITSNIRNLIKDTDDEKRTDPNLMKVDRDAKQIEKCGGITLIISNG